MLRKLMFVCLGVVIGLSLVVGPMVINDISNLKEDNAVLRDEIINLKRVNNDLNQELDRLEMKHDDMKLSAFNLKIRYDNLKYDLNQKAVSSLEELEKMEQ